jgi:hypothetical protein
MTLSPTFNHYDRLALRVVFFARYEAELDHSPAVTLDHLRRALYEKPISPAVMDACNIDLPLAGDAKLALAQAEELAAGDTVTFEHLSTVLRGGATGKEPSGHE